MQISFDTQVKNIYWRLSARKGMRSKGYSCVALALYVRRVMRIASRVSFDSWSFEFGLCSAKELNLIFS